MSLSPDRESHCSLEQFKSGLEVIKGFSIISTEENAVKNPILIVKTQAVSQEHFRKNLLYNYLLLQYVLLC